jgi:hypothetical protein
MPQLRFMVKKSKLMVHILKRKNDLLHVEYDISGMRSWYTIEDFKRLFVKIE